MITKVTKDNHTQYTSLFDAANKVLNIDSQSGDAIGSLEEYFQAFGNITTASSATKFVALPLDEPIFEINADTREIKVPSAFSTYGLSVKGDQRAEIVYFSIDRYFDTTDLFDPVTDNNTDGINIIIQWEVTQSGATKVRGVSKALFQDVEILKSEGKMLFGWAINNAITGYTGSVKFSVRFYSVNSDKEVTFSLSTLTATAPIKDGLDFEISDGAFTTTVYDDSVAIRSRYQNSIVTDEEKLPAQPIFFYDGNPVLPTSDGFVIGNAQYVDLDPETGKYTFKVQAYSTDGGTAKMTYTWKVNGNEEVNTNSNTTYIETEDEDWNENKLYYIRRNTSGVYTYELVTADRETTDFTELFLTEGGLYERFGSCEVSQVGSYVATALNRQKKGAEAGVESFYSSETDSIPVIIAEPGELTLTITGAESGEDGKYQARTIAEKEAVLTITGDTTHAEWPTKDKVTYSWSTDDEDYTISTNNMVLDSGIPCALTVDLSDLDDANILKYDHTFTVKTKASRNKVSTEEQEKVFRVTAPAAELQANPTEVSVYRVAGTATLTVHISNYNDVLHDAIEYHWFAYTNDGEDNNDIEITEGITSEGATSSIVVTDVGAYYCKVTNIVNGSTAISTSSRIQVS